MSFAKRAIIEDEKKRAAAVSVALEAGELAQCDLICEQVYEQHSTDPLKYRIGNAWISNYDPRVAPFKATTQDRNELRDMLENLWTDFPNACRCRSLRYEN